MPDEYIDIFLSKTATPREIVLRKAIESEASGGASILQQLRADMDRGKFINELESASWRSALSDKPGDIAIEYEDDQYELIVTGETSSGKAYHIWRMFLADGSECAFMLRLFNKSLRIPNTSDEAICLLTETEIQSFKQKQFSEPKLLITSTVQPLTTSEFNPTTDAPAPLAIAGERAASQLPGARPPPPL